MKYWPGCRFGVILFVPFTYLPDVQMISFLRPSPPPIFFLLLLYSCHRRLVGVTPHSSPCKNIPSVPSGTVQQWLQIRKKMTGVGSNRCGLFVPVKAVLPPRRRHASRCPCTRNKDNFCRSPQVSYSWKLRMTWTDYWFLSCPFAAALLIDANKRDTPRVCAVLVVPRRHQTRTVLQQWRHLPRVPACAVVQLYASEGRTESNFSLLIAPFANHCSCFWLPCVKWIARSFGEPTDRVSFICAGEGD